MRCVASVGALCQRVIDSYLLPIDEQALSRILDVFCRFHVVKVNERETTRETRHFVINDLDVLDMADATEVVEEKLLRGVRGKVEDAEAGRCIWIQAF